MKYFNNGIIYLSLDINVFLYIKFLDKYKKITTSVFQKKLIYTLKYFIS